MSGVSGTSEFRPPEDGAGLEVQGQKKRLKITPSQPPSSAPREAASLIGRVQRSFAPERLHDLAQREIAAGHPAVAFSLEKMAVEAFPIAPTHPLWNMDQAIDEGSSKQHDPKLGACFSSLDASLLKGGHLHATHRNIDGQLVNSFDFKISHYARDELTAYLKCIVDNPHLFAESLPEGFCSGVTIDQNAPQCFLKFDQKKTQFTRKDAYAPGASTATAIEFEGVGKVIIGNDPTNGTMYNWIQVEMEANLAQGVGVKRLHQMLGSIGLGPILAPQPPEADERLKIAQLFRAFYPSKASHFDVTKQFYQLPIAKLKEAIIAKEPDMRPLFEKYLDRSPELMKKVAIMPGKEVWAITDYGQQMRANGAWGLMQGVGQAGWESAKAAIVRLLTHGALSSEQRFQQGTFTKGISSEDDFKAGGADQVFCFLVNELTGKEEIKTIFFSGSIQVLWKLDELVQRVPYGHETDRYGGKNRYSPFPNFDYLPYLNRQSLIDFATTDSLANEVMIKNAIDPKFLAGFVVESQEKKLDLIEHLNKCGLARQLPDGTWVIKVKERELPAESFIQVGNKLKKEWFYT